MPLAARDAWRRSPTAKTFHGFCKQHLQPDALFAVMQAVAEGSGWGNPRGIWVEYPYKGELDPLLESVGFKRCIGTMELEEFENWINNSWNWHPNASGNSWVWVLSPEYALLPAYTWEGCQVYGLMRK